MDKSSFLKVIEIVVALRFKCMGSYPADKIPQLTKHFFAIQFSPSNDRGENWIMVARIDKNCYSADSLGRRRSTYSFLTKKYPRLVQLFKFLFLQKQKKHLRN